MERAELLRLVAPCGLVCFTCTAAKNGAIMQHSQTMLELLDGFDGFAERFSNYEPRLKKYPDFKDILLMFSEASCEGCRGGVCMYPDCYVSPCTIEKGYDFCYECDSFPCEDVNFDPGLKRKWRTANHRMRDIGVEGYFLESKDRSHYR